MKFAIYLTIISLLDMSAILLARYYVETKKPIVMWGSLLSFALSGYIYVKMMAFAVTAIINIIYIAFSNIVITLVCYFFFKERVTFGQTIGIILVIIGIFMLEKLSFVYMTQAVMSMITS